MPNRKLHKIKEKYKKITVILLCIFFVLGPLHKQISKALHAITHAIEMPDHIISHNSKKLHIQTHNSIKHIAKKTKHNHKILDLVTDFLNFNKNSTLPQNKIIKSNIVDKHIKIKINFKEVNPVKSALNTENNFTNNNTKLCKGFFSFIKEPPQVAYN